MAAHAVRPAAPEVVDAHVHSRSSRSVRRRSTVAVPTDGRPRDDDRRSHRRDSRHRPATLARRRARSSSSGRRPTSRPASGTPTSGRCPPTARRRRRSSSAATRPTTRRALCRTAGTSPSSRRATARRRCTSRTPRAATSRRSPTSRWACSRRSSFARRLTAGLRLRRLPGVRRRRVQQAQKARRPRRTRSRCTGSRGCSTALGRMARERSPSRLRAPLPAWAAVDVTPGDFDSPPAQAEDGAIAFSPDGREVAFVSNRDGNDREAWSTNSDVWTVPAGGGAAKKLTTNPAPDASRSTHPTARRSSCGRSGGPGSNRIAGTSTPTIARPAPNGSSSRPPTSRWRDYTLSTDGSSIWFTAAQDGREKRSRFRQRVGRQSASNRRRISSHRRAGPGFVVFSKSSLTAPADTYRASADGSGPRAEASAPAHARKCVAEDVAFTPPESLSVAGADGAKIQYWLMKPPDFDASRKYPVVFLIHGGPQGALGRRLVGALESVALGRAGLGGRRAESARIASASARRSSIESRATGAARS